MSRALIRLAAAIALIMASMPAFAQAWPAKPIRLVVAYPPGGVTDVVARLVAQPLSEALGQTVLVENKPGAAGMIGSESVASAAPDGHTLLMFVDGNTILPSIMKQMPYDTLRAFAPITVLGRGSHVIVVHPNLPVRSLGELVDYARKRPGELSYASPGLASPQSLSVEAIKSAKGIDLVHVPYKGGGQAIVDLIAGQIQVGSLGSTPIMPHYRAGKLRVLAQSTKRRSSALPDVPTYEEAGYKGLVIDQWLALFAPAATPREVVLRLNAEFGKALASPGVRERYASAALDPVGGTPEQLARVLRDDYEKYGKLAKELAIKVD